jgi:hypothetical protein
MPIKKSLAIIEVQFSAKHTQKQGFLENMDLAVYGLVSEGLSLLWSGDSEE